MCRNGISYSATVPLALLLLLLPAAVAQVSTVNGKAPVNGNVILGASDVKAVPLSGGSLTGQITVPSLAFNSPQNSQDVGGAGTQGDSSCPDLSLLAANQYALCYRTADAAYELGYPRGAYSPLVRFSDLTAALSNLQAAPPATVSSPTTTTTSTTGTTKMGAVLEAQQTGTSTQYIGAAFTAVQLPTVSSDTASAFETGSNSYVVPAAGWYQCAAKLRFLDGTAPGISFGVGIGTSLMDAPYFSWYTTQTGLRQGATYTRLVHFNAGDRVMMYAYVGGTALPILSADLTMVMLGQ